MFNVSGLEILVIIIVALLVFGPEQLPGLAKGIGSWMKQAKQVIARFKDELNKVSEEPPKPTDEQKNEPRSPTE